jgi:hypothetical protein
MKPAGDARMPETRAGGSNTTHGSARVDRTPWLQWWPTLLGLGLAAFIALDMTSGSTQAPVLTASGLVYLGTAALQKPSAAWPLFIATFAIITATTVLARLRLANPDPTWILLGLAALLLLYGLLRGATRPFGALPLQSIAMVACGMAASAALIISGKAGAYVVAAGLLGHAAWDVYHHWANKVVVRSMAEFSFVLDTLLAVAIVIATLRS